MNTIWPSEIWGEEAIRRARRAVAQAIRRGRLMRPDRCERCGDRVGDPWIPRKDIERIRMFPELPVSRIQAIGAHHHRGYAPEHWLDLQWLCGGCHNQTEKEEAERRWREAHGEPAPNRSLEEMRAAADRFAAIGRAAPPTKAPRRLSDRELFEENAAAFTGL